MPPKSLFSALGVPMSRRGGMGALMSRIWTWQNPSRVASSVFTKLASGGCRLNSVFRT